MLTCTRRTRGEARGTAVARGRAAPHLSANALHSRRTFAYAKATFCRFAREGERGPLPLWGKVAGGAGRMRGVARSATALNLSAPRRTNASRETSILEVRPSGEEPPTHQEETMRTLAILALSVGLLLPVAAFAAS